MIQVFDAKVVIIPQHINVSNQYLNLHNSGVDYISVKKYFYKRENKLLQYLSHYQILLVNGFRSQVRIKPAWACHGVGREPQGARVQEMLCKSICLGPKEGRKNKGKEAPVSL